MMNCNSIHQKNLEISHKSPSPSLAYLKLEKSAHGYTWEPADPTDEAIYQPEGIPKQARMRKALPPPPVSNTCKRKDMLDSHANPSTDEELAAISDKPDQDNCDTITLAFARPAGSNKLPKMLLTLKTPKVLDVRIKTNSVSTQVNHEDFDLSLHPPLSKKPSTTSRKSKKSRKSIKSKKSLASRKSKKSKAPWTSQIKKSKIPGTTQSKITGTRQSIGGAKKK